jgi:hypothetical protein
MAEESNVKSPVEFVPSVEGEVSAIGSGGAPFLYFDLVPTYGFNRGIAKITLEALRLHTTAGGVKQDRVVVAHLRMGLDAAIDLRKALDGIILMAEPKPEGPAN